MVRSGRLRTLLEEKLDFGIDFDLERSALVEPEVLCGAIGWNNPVAISPSLLSGVVASLKRLDRVIRGADRRSGCEPAIFLAKPLNAPHPIALDDVASLELGPFDRKTQEIDLVRVLTLDKVPGENHDIRAGNCATAQNRAAAGFPHSVFHSQPRIAHHAATTM